MKWETIVAIIAGLVILLFLFYLVIDRYSEKGIDIFKIAIEKVDRLIGESPLLTGNMTDWPEMAQ